MNNNNDNRNDMALEEQIESRELAPGVILYKEYKKDPENKDAVGLFIWKVEITTMSVVDFEVHLDQSENIELAGKNPNDELKTISRIEPFQKVEVARVILKNNWKLKSKFKLTLNIPDKDTQMDCIREERKTLEDEIRQNYQILYKIPTEILSKEEIEAILARENIKFIDLDFLPNDDAMVNPVYGDNLKDLFEYVVHWRRPEEFVFSENVDADLAEIRVFNEYEPDPNDIQQGILPDNHLVSALSALAEKCNLIKRLFKSDAYSKFGFYQVKLCINGEWVTTCVDDLFPCIPKSNPLVSRSPGSELWVLILEKALAKIYESYYTLVTINISEYLMLLTGCPTVYLDLKEMVKFEGPENLLKKIKQFVVDKKYLSVAISKSEGEFMNNNANNNNNNDEYDDNTLTVPNFGYTILDVKSKYKDDLIILRKVWYDQKKEEKIKKYEEELLRSNPSHKTDMNEGTLVLTYEDFLREFEHLSVCYTKNWDEVRIRGKFVSVVEQENQIDPMETVLSKWYYSIQVDKPTNIIISLHQDEDIFKDMDSRKQKMDISLTILKQDTSANEITHVESLDFANSPNVQMELSFPPGSYIILPRSTGCCFGRDNSRPSNSKTPLYNKDEKNLTPIFISTIKDIFKKFDMLLNRELKHNEFKGFWECVNNSSISAEEFKSNILFHYTRASEGLSEKGFINFFKDIYVNKGEDLVRGWLDNLGYDQDLYPLRSRCFMLTFHSDNPIAVSVRDALNTDLNYKVNKIILKSFGEEKIINAGNNIYSIEYHSKNNNVVTVGVMNKSEIPNKVVLDFSKDNNIKLSSKKSKIEKIVNPGQLEFFTHYLYNFSDENVNRNIDAYNFLYYPLK